MMPNRDPRKPSVAPGPPCLYVEGMSDVTPPDNWKLENDTLKRVFVFDDFPHAVGFVVEMGKLAEDAYHHPDIDIRWNKVHVSLCTHDAGDTVTRKDEELAGRLNAIGDAEIEAAAAALFGKS